MARKPINQQVVDAWNDGMPVWQIAEIQGRKEGAVKSAVRKAQIKGDAVYRKKRQTRKRSKIANGPSPLVLEIKGSLTSETWDWMYDKIKRDEYRGLAEYLSDIIAEDFYNETGFG